ncbi:thermonuclease family protein [Domibacillus enclensis]|uniref:Micrococcal nuclease n=1 Tax=Domibacillus enclensis TaxID=1017273 RepID=A0A1N6WE88_9BACI|nr:thermonuclease family protein [Domibacillus enclensis]OXS77914.1 hypothetical protein B1B05_09920 [Domibacillus enclensis]SIQ88338.1 micrococcal nuclease [Domibacillus enclensis]
MKIIKIIIAAIALFFALILCVITPWALVGVLVVLVGLFAWRRPVTAVKKPFLFVLLGPIISFILAMIFFQPASETMQQVQEAKNEKIEERDAESEKKAAALEEKEKELAEKEQELADKEAAALETEKEIVKEEASVAEETSKLVSAKVLSVTDGDTIKVDLNGKEESVRLILVDTPETKHPQLGKQPLGDEASAFTTEQLSGKEIQIEPGVEERDRYGRLLAYIYVGDKMFNKTLIEKGLARVAVYPPNTEYLDELETAQATAKEQGIGIWEVENYATEDGYDAAAYEPEPEPEPVVVAEPEPEPAPEPEPVVEEPVAQVESFQNCTALRAVYPDGVPAGHPAYASKHDRDGDDYACEN